MSEAKNSSAASGASGAAAQKAGAEGAAQFDLTAEVGSNATPGPSDLELVIKRVFDAPRDLVFKGMD